MGMDPDHEHSNVESIEEYGDEGIASLDAPVPKWLKFNYVLWIVFGLIWFYLFCNGSTVSYFDRGYWFELQKAANTTFPTLNVDELPEHN
jgi:hypothetical protein